MKLRRLKWYAAVLVLLYVASYLLVSTRGFYEPVVYGALQGRDGHVILAPKSPLGYRWSPYGVDTRQGIMEVKWVTFLFLPIVMLDRAVWHTPARVGTLRYRTKNYFDYDKMEYSDFNW